MNEDRKKRLHGPSATAAVIVAGGSSRRMGESSTVPKQFLELDGIPIVVRTLLAFEAADCIDEIVAVIRSGDEPLYRAYKQQYHLHKLRCAVHGGETRQDSVLAGFAAIDAGARFVAIADAARPLITPEQIDAVCRLAHREGAAAACRHVTDTVKTTDAGNKHVTGTLDRDRIVLVQTPQIFDVRLYAAAAYSAKEAGFAATDDCALLERIGRTVALYDTGADNLKITVPDDLEQAAWILRKRQKQEEQL